MVEYSVRGEIVNGMYAARRRGHGCVRPFLRSRGVAPASGYRWKKELDWLMEHGQRELRQLRGQLDKLSARLAERGAAQAVPAMSAKAERRLILEAAVTGNSDGTIAALVAAGGGRHLSHETVNAEVAKTAAVARAAFERFFAGHGRVGAADEIFLGRGPALLLVEPRSLLISGARLAGGRTAEDWSPVVAAMQALELCASDAGAGVTKALDEGGVRRVADLFHLLGKAEAWLARSEKAVGAHWAAVEKTRCVLERPPGQPGRRPKPRVANYEEARQAADRELADWCRLADLCAQAKATTDLVTPQGRLNTPRRASATLAEVLAEMAQTEEGKGLATALGGFERQPAFAHLGVLGEKLAGLGLEQLGPDRGAKLGPLVAEALAWRRTDKTSVEWLAQASTGSLADEIELAVLRAVDAAIRSSSAAECVNSRVRPVQVARKRLSEDFIYLLAVYHNLRPFGRGSVREGQTPAELAGIQLPTRDWIELLDLVAADLDRTTSKAA